MSALPDVRRSTKALSLAFSLFVAIVLVGIGHAIAVSLDSALLGFIGADMIFLIAMSVLTSGGARSRDR